MNTSTPEMNEYQFRDMIHFFNKKFEEGDPQAAWTKATQINLPRIKKENGIRTTRNQFQGEKEKCIVIVGASPKAKEDVKFLKELDDKFVLVVVNSALKMVLKEGVKPDYVIMIDSYDPHMVSHLDIDNGEYPYTSKDLTLITTNASSYKAIAKWKGPILWCPYYSIDPFLRPQIRKMLGRKIPAGGNSFSFAASLAYDVWDARMFIFVGNELCYDDHYYADKRSKWEKRNIVHFKVNDVKGRERYTNIPLYQYKMWMEKMMGELPHCVFIDTSDGILGTNAPGLSHMGLPDAIREVKSAFALRYNTDMDWRSREKIKYDIAYNVGGYCPYHGKDMWKRLFKLVDFGKLKTALDVGCGFGQGIAMCRNKGIEAYGCDISSGLTPYWGMANIVPFCRVASADQIPFEDGKFDLVVCVDVLEHIPEEAVSASFAEMARVGKMDFVYEICTIPAVTKFAVGHGEPHICVKPLDWWVEKVRESGLNIHQKVMSSDQTHVTIIASKGGKDGGPPPRKSVFHKEQENA